jgi:hypothetical protein
VNDIGNLIPVLSKAIDSYGYDPEILTMGFRFEGMPVIIERFTVTVYDRDDEEIARKVIMWLNGKIAKIGDLASIGDKRNVTRL